MITLTGDPAQGAIDGRRGARHGLTGSAPPSSTVLQPLLPRVRLRAPRLPDRGLSRRPPPAGATTPAIASRSLLFEQIPSVFEQVASAALVTSSPGRGARQLARRCPCFPELQVELSGARRVAVAAAAVGEGSGGNRRRDSACVPRCATTSRCRHRERRGLSAIATKTVRLWLAGRGEKIREMVCRFGARVPIRGVVVRTRTPSARSLTGC